MKRSLIVLSTIVSLLLMLSSCSDGPYYKEGFDDGFSAGVEYCEEQHAEIYEEGYEMGRETRTPYWIILDEAYAYAEDRSEWSVYEAAQNISLFLDGEPGVTEEEYEESVVTLLHFYSFLSSCDYLLE